MTVKTVDIAEAQTQLAELVAQAAMGVEIILTDGQIPQARLLPISSPSTSRVPGLHRGHMTLSAEFDNALPDQFWQGEL